MIAQTFSRNQKNDRYMEIPSATFCSGKYGILEDFCHAGCLAYYTLENRLSKTCEYQPGKLDNNLIENNHEEFSYNKKNKSGEAMRCRKVRRILRCHMPNKLLSPEKFAHHVLLLFNSVHR